MVNKIAIMQPYFFPYYGYFQLLSHVDTFVIYDNIEYTKKGWINRNRMTLNDGRVFYITLPLKKDSDYLHVNQRQLSNLDDAMKLTNRIIQTYKKCPYIRDVEDILMTSFDFDKDLDYSLFDVLLKSIQTTCRYLNIDTEIKISSEISIDHKKKSQDKVIALCKKLNADEYINPIGGRDLYSDTTFADNGIKLRFLDPTCHTYTQFQHKNSFVPNLSILDMVANVSRLDIANYFKKEVKYVY